MSHLRKESAPTAADVARVAGVSAMTVSRVLRCNGYVSDYTRAKVWQAVRQLGYQPNRAAQALASRRAR